MKNLNTFGKALYELRNSKDVSLEKISQITKIDQEYFEEFEKGNFSMKSEVYIRLFLIEYVKCIDAIKVEEIMNKFDKSYNGKSHNKTLTFVPTSNNKADSSKSFNTDTILNSKNYTPKKIALIIFTFLIIMLVFWAVGFLSNQS